MKAFFFFFKIKIKNEKLFTKNFYKIVESDYEEENYCKIVESDYEEENFRKQS